MKTYKKFKYLKSINTRLSWVTANKLRDMFNEGKLTLIEDSLKGKYSFDTINLKNDRTWSTYDGCREAHISMKDGKIILMLTYYNGSILDGQRESLRWTAKFEGLNGKSISLFSKEINGNFLYAMEGLYLMEEEMKKKERIEVITNEILDTI